MGGNCYGYLKPSSLGPQGGEISLWLYNTKLLRVPSPLKIIVARRIQHPIVQKNLYRSISPSFSGAQIVEKPIWLHNCYLLKIAIVAKNDYGCIGLAIVGRYQWGCIFSGV